MRVLALFTPVYAIAFLGAPHFLSLKTMASSPSGQSSHQPRADGPSRTPLPTEFVRVWGNGSARQRGRQAGLNQKAVNDRGGGISEKPSVTAAMLA